MQYFRILFATVLLPLALQSAAGQASSLPAPTAYWRLDGEAADFSGNGHHATAAYGVTPTADRFNAAGKAYAFPGSFSVESYVSFGRPSALQFSGNCTVAAWAKFHGGTTNPRILSYGQTSGIELGTKSTAANRQYFFVFGGQDIFTNGSYTSNEWHHVVGVKSGNVIRIYVDGVLDNSATNTGVAAYSTDLEIGRKSQHFDDRWGGAIDDVSLYAQALTDAQVWQLYAGSAALPIIAVQPKGGTVAQGSAVDLTVEVTNSGPVTYQWTKDGVNLPGATTSTYSIPAAQAWHIGDFRVKVTNPNGTATSDTARLSIIGETTSLWQGLLSYHPFAGTESDSTPFGNSATNAGASLTADRFGQAERAFQFSGAQNIGVAVGGIPTGTQPRTLSVWCQAAEGLAGTAVTAQWGAAANRQAFGAIANGVPLRWWAASFGGGNDADSGVAVDTRWHHLVATYDGSLRIYVDGALKQTKAISLVTVSSNLSIGASVAGDQRFRGKLDDVRVYNRALSAADVQALYMAEAPPPVIEREPLGVLVTEGETASLSVAAFGGSTALSYQWLKGDDLIDGATSATLSIGPVAYDDRGEYRVRITNLAGSVESAAATVTVNRQPSPLADTFHPSGAGPFALPVLQNDTDADEGDVLSITGVGSAAFGDITIAGAHLSYTPRAGFTGNDSFTYTLSDGRGGSASATVTFANAPPAAQPIALSTLRRSVSIDITSSVSDPDADAVSLVSALGATRGTLSTSGNTITYQPAAGLRGSAGDAFTYTVSDHHGGTASATITVQLSGPEYEVDLEASTSAADGTGGAFSTLADASVDSTGTVAFTGNLPDAIKGKRTALLFAGRDIARAGVAPGGHTARFLSFSAPVLNGLGEVSFLARMLTQEGAVLRKLWHDDGALHLLAEEQAAAGGVPGALFAELREVVFPKNGAPLFTASLVRGVGGVRAQNDFGIWRASGAGAAELLLREGDPVQVGSTQRTIAELAFFASYGRSFDQRRGFNDQGAVLARARLLEGGSALVQPVANGTARALLATGDPVPGGPKLSTFGLPALGNDGGVSVRATLLRERGQVSLRDDAVVLHRTPAGAVQIVARTGFAIAVPSGAVLATCDDPVGGEGGRLAFRGTLRPGFGGVTAANAEAIWRRAGDGTLSVIARKGDVAAEAPGFRYAAFKSVAWAGDERFGVVFLAQLSPAGKGGVAPLALFAEDSTGTMRMLVRTGQKLEAGDSLKEVRSVTTLGAYGGSSSHGHSYSRDGLYVAVVSFTDGSRSVVRFWLP